MPNDAVLRPGAGSAVPDPVAAVAAAGSLLASAHRDGAVRDTARHAHPPGQLIGSVEGLLSIETPAGRWVVPATHAVWVPPREPHALRSHGPFRGWSVYVAEAACAGMAAVPRTIRVGGLLRELVGRAASWERTPEDGAERRLAAVLLDEIAAAPSEPLGLPRPRDDRLARIVDAMLSDPGDRRSFAAWAALGGIPVRTLSRRFVAETGFTFAAWRQRARVLRAMEMLAGGAAVTTVALDSGYDNVSAFIGMFSRAAGTTPGRYGEAERRSPR